MTSPSNLPSDSEILARMNRLESSVSSLVGAIGQLVEKNRPPEPEVTDEELAQKPSLLLKKLTDHIDSQMKPINDFRVQAQREAEYMRNKDIVKNSNEIYKKLWDKIEPTLDLTIKQANVEPSVQIINYHVNALIGNYVLSNPDALKTGEPPLHIPPSGPINQDGGGNKPPVRELTENEKIIAKQRGWTAEEYLKKSEGEHMVVTRGEKK